MCNRGADRLTPHHSSPQSLQTHELDSWDVVRLRYIAMLHMMRIAVVTAVAIASQSSGGTVLPIYRDLLEERPFNEADYFDRCGSGAGPLELLKPTDRVTREQLVREVDAAKVPASAERALSRAAAALPGATVNVCVFMGELSRGLPYLDGV